MLIKILSVFAFLAIFLGTSTPMHSQKFHIVLGYNEEGQEICIDGFENDYVTEKPSFPGGEDKLMEFINEHRVYPRQAYDKGIEGRVTCWFIVNSDGSISNISLKRSVNYFLDMEALRIFSLMPDWIPGRIDGIPVPVRVMRSVRFKK